MDNLIDYIPEDIRNRLLEHVFRQTLKLLDPTCSQYTKYFDDPNNIAPSQREIMYLNERIVRYIRTGDFDLQNLEKNERLPYINIQIADGGFTRSYDEEAETQQGPPWNMVEEMMPFNLILVLKQSNVPGKGYTYENSNPVTLLRLRDQLDFVHDGSYYRGINDQGIRSDFYSMPSQVQDVRIADTELLDLEMATTLYDIVNFRLETTFWRHKEIDITN